MVSMSGLLGPRLVSSVQEPLAGVKALWMIRLLLVLTTSIQFAVVVFSAIPPRM